MNTQVKDSLTVHSLNIMTMNTQNKPEMKPLQTGSTVKTVQISGKAGMVLPTHRSTQEAVVIVQEGTAVLSMPYKEYTLEKGDNFIIPANVDHHLSLKTDFRAIGVMMQGSTIEFEQ